MDIILKYIDELLEKSTPEAPIWNIEKVRQGLKSKWNYIDGCMIKAVLEMYAISKDEKYLKFADDFIDFRVREDGTIDGYNVNEKNIDNVNAGKTLFELYDITGKEKYRKAIDLVYSQIAIMPRCESGNFWHKDIYPNQIWLDGMYMGQPFYMEYETRFNSRKNYPDIFNQFKYVIQNLRNPVNGLYYHAIDTSKKMFWCDKVTGLSQNMWLRAIGWYSMALLDTLDKVDNSDHKFDKECDMMKDAYVDLMKSMIKYQDESGMWYQVVNFGGMNKNYLETSGSSIMAYSILKGVRLGYLPESYRKYGEKAMEGICDKYLTTKEGEMSLGGICLVAGLGGNSKRAGTYDYYMSEPIVEDDAKGVGPFLLAYTEILRLKHKGNL
jgi:unsaturated rhamnogalacturonyl hydrolase